MCVCECASVAVCNWFNKLIHGPQKQILIFFFVWKFGFWPGEVMEKSWKFFLRFLWEPCLSVCLSVCVFVCVSLSLSLSISLSRSLSLEFIQLFWLRKLQQFVRIKGKFQIWNLVIIGSGATYAEIQNYWLPYRSLGPMGHDPYASQNTGNGSHHWYFYTLEILGCVPRTQVVNSWWVPFEI